MVGDPGARKGHGSTVVRQSTSARHPDDLPDYLPVVDGTHKVAPVTAEESTAPPQEFAALNELESQVPPKRAIPVNISYEIIALFSEGLYQSPQKAVEELVSNSYDAEATAVHVLLPQGQAEEDIEPSEDPVASSEQIPSKPLWVIDDGTGLDEAGFLQLWRVAGSAKAELVVQAGKRKPIGQFGIGKLAAYVLAWRLTHLSKVGNVVRMTSMNFRDVSGMHQYDNVKPFELQMREMTLEQAQTLLADVKERDPAAWALMFGPDSSETWTAAGLSDFKNLYSKLTVGLLRWVLRTGLPLHSDFKIWVDGQQLTPSKESLQEIKAVTVGEEDAAAAALKLETVVVDGRSAVMIPGLEGHIFGRAVIYGKKLTGKSERIGRSNGFFVRVRGRVINVDDELFGLPTLNHASWSRFSMEVEADGLRSHLLSSREGVRSSVPIDRLRAYLHAVFNECRRAYDDWQDEEDDGLDVARLLNDAPSAYVTEPLIAGVGSMLARDDESYYIARVNVPEEEQAAWLETFANAVAAQPFTDFRWEATGQYDRSVRYYPDTRELVVNIDHPFISKLMSAGKTRSAATLFASSELLVDVLLQEHGVGASDAISFMRDRDRVLRLVAGQEPTSAAEVLRLLRSALTNETALERAVGLAFRAIGFEYERRGANQGGTDGVLYARLGRGSDSLEDYRIVYDAKQTKATSVSATKIDIQSLEEFRESEGAHFSFFIAPAYDAESDATGSLTRKVNQALAAKIKVTMLKVEHLRTLVSLHYQYGLPLTRLRSLFETAHTVPQVDGWLHELQRELAELPRVPLARLLERLQDLKSDTLATPTVAAARVGDELLSRFRPDKLSSTLSAVQEIVGERWIEVSSESGEVRLHHTAAQITAEVERHLRDILDGVDATEHPPVS